MTESLMILVLLFPLLAVPLFFISQTGVALWTLRTGALLHWTFVIALLIGSPEGHVITVQWLKTFGASLKFTLDGSNSFSVFVFSSFFLAHAFTLGRLGGVTKFRLALVQLCAWLAGAVLMCDSLFVWMLLWALLGVVSLGLRTSLLGEFSHAGHRRETASVCLTMLAVFSAYFAATPFSFDVTELHNYFTSHPATGYEIFGVGVSPANIFLLLGGAALFCRLPRRVSLVSAPLETFFLPTISLLSFFRTILALFPAYTKSLSHVGFCLGFALIVLPYFTKDRKTPQQREINQSAVYFFLGAIVLSFSTFQWMGWFGLGFLVVSLGIICLRFSDAGQASQDESGVASILLRLLPGTPGFIGFAALYMALSKQSAWLVLLFAAVHLWVFTRLYPSAPGYLQIHKRLSGYRFVLPEVVLAAAFGLIPSFYYSWFGRGIQAALDKINL